MKQIFVLAIAAALSACTSLPDITYQYYQPKSATTFTVTEGVQCVKNPASDKDHPTYTEIDFTTSIPTPVTNYSADYTQPAPPVLLRKFDRTFSDTDATFTFTEDGRLVSMNATMTGQAETILKSAISLGTSIAAFAPLVLALDGGSPPPPRDAANQICQIIMGWPNSDKAALTFTTVANLNDKVVQWPTWLDDEKNWKIKYEKAVADHSPQFPLEPLQPSVKLTDVGGTTSVSDQDLYDCLRYGSCKTCDKSGSCMGKVKFQFGAKVPKAEARMGDLSPTVHVAALDKAAEKKVRTIQLQDTASVRLDYFVDNKQVLANSNTVVVPLKGKVYLFAIPKPEPFGAAKAALTLAPSGAITSIEYSKTNGAAGAMNVATSAFTAATPAATTPPSTPDPGTKKPTDSTDHPITGTGGHP